MRRDNIEFPGEGGVTLRGWFYYGHGVEGPAATIVMTHGMTAVKELFLNDYAKVLAEAGLNVVVYDHRNYGASDGAPRQETDPVLQCRDIRNAITYACARPEVDASRIGLWGTGFAGGHALLVAAIDRRVRAVVSQVPFISGSRTFSRAVRPDVVAQVREYFDVDRLNRFKGGEPAMLAAVTNDPTGQAMMPAPDAYEWFTKRRVWRAPDWKNTVTARSLEMASEYEPGSYISRISPTPLLMLVANNDTVAPCQLALDAYEEAHEPKEIRVLPGGHFDVYTGPGFQECAAAAQGHFVKHLTPDHAARARS